MKYVTMCLLMGNHIESDTYCIVVTTDEYRYALTAFMKKSERVELRLPDGRTMAVDMSKAVAVNCGPESDQP